MFGIFIQGSCVVDLALVRTRSPGETILIQLWAWDRFPFIAPRRKPVPRDPPRTCDGVYMPNDVPLGYRWIVAFSVTRTATHVISSFRDALDTQRENAVEWQPYADVIESLPQLCTQGYGSWRSTCPLICFHIVEWHRPERVMRQFGLTQVVPPHCDFDTRLHRVQLRGHPQENWAVYHRRYIELWENRSNTITTIQQEGEHDHEEYMRWYRSITRRYIGHDGALREFSSTFARQLERVFSR
ncbi:hypothetical protein Sjap_018156 [Stephania japonica]|uniref:Aminotransferase-like plant mobile domain-containing protein n=1 Tax=Stephania japonica TaxID=461633 RepID=A0AAP0NMV1_9MAGN